MIYLYCYIFMIFCCAFGLSIATAKLEKENKYLSIGLVSCFWPFVFVYLVFDLIISTGEAIGRRFRKESK